jgi:hypothetical protein
MTYKISHLIHKNLFDKGIHKLFIINEQSETPFEDNKESNFGREIDGLQRPRARRNRRPQRYKHTTNEIRRTFIHLAASFP